MTFSLFIYIILYACLVIQNKETTNWWFLETLSINSLIGLKDTQFIIIHIWYNPIQWNSSRQTERGQAAAAAAKNIWCRNEKVHKKIKKIVSEGGWDEMEVTFDCFFIFFPPPPLFTIIYLYWSLSGDIFTGFIQLNCLTVIIFFNGMVGRHIFGPSRMLWRAATMESVCTFVLHL